MTPKTTQPAYPNCSLQFGYLLQNTLPYRKKTFSSTSKTALFSSATDRSLHTHTHTDTDTDTDTDTHTHTQLIYNDLPDEAVIRTRRSF